MLIRKNHTLRRLFSNQYTLSAVTKVVLITLSMGIGVSLQAKEGPCKQDRETLCKDIEPGDGRLAKCFKDNEDKISAGCKAHREKMREGMKEAKEICEDDIAKYCESEEGKGGGLRRCLRKNMDSLSSGCQEALKALKEKRKGA